MKNKKMITYVVVTIIIMVAIIVAIISLRFTAAAYRKDNKWNYNYSSAHYYISSDLLLDEDENQDVYFKRYDYTKIPFKVYNYQTDTQISKEDITYNLSCETSTNNYSCSIDNQSGGRTGISLPKSTTTSGGTTTYNKNTNNHYLKVTKNGSPSATSVVVTVTLTVTSPFKRVLSAQLIININNEDTGIQANLIGASDYQCEYIITNFGDAATLSISTPSSGNIIFKTNKTKSLSFSMDKYERKSVFLYKKASDTCGNNTLTITTS